MGIEVSVYLERLNKENGTWKLIEIYDKTNELLPLWMGKGDIKDILLNDFSDYSENVPDDGLMKMSESLQKIYDDYQVDFIPMFSVYAQLKQYIRDFDLEDCPLQDIINRMDIVADMAGEYSWNTSYLYEYRIVFWGC